MMVCHCHSVSSRELDEVIDRGAATVAEVGEACGAGTCCGSCRPLIEVHLATRRPAPARPSALEDDPHRDRSAASASAVSASAVSAMVPA